MPYEEAYEIVQNREWEQQDDFGGDLADLNRRHKRVKRAPCYILGIYYLVCPTPAGNLSSIYFECF